jgi:hypothetical protein
MAKSVRPTPSTILIVENEAIAGLELARWLAEYHAQPEKLARENSQLTPK